VGEDKFQPASLDLSLGRQELRVRWTDGFEVSYPTRFLRARCPCALCRTNRERQSRSLLPVLSAVQSAEVRAIGGQLVGNYALLIHWSDGHETGIYDFKYLRHLADELGERSA